MHTTLIAPCGAIVLAAQGSAFAHITLEEPQAPAASTYRAVLRVGHGCNGSPTVSIRVQIPGGVADPARAQPHRAGDL